MKKGFTLIELLAVIVIIGIIGGIGIISVRSYIKTGDEKYFNALESDMLLAGNDYFTDHRGELPTGNNYSEVSLTDLVSKKYFEQPKDSKGNNCTEGKVYVYRENGKYTYEACLTCGGYESTGTYCQQSFNKKIIMSARTKDTNQSYPLTTYSAAGYTKNENVIVNLSMADTNVVKYGIINTKTNAEEYCNTGGSTSCELEVSASGTYKVTAYGENNKVIATNQYFNVKIARNGPQFTINGPEKYTLQQSESQCNNSLYKTTVTYTIKKGNVNQEFSSIKYRFIKEGDNQNNIEYKDSNSLTISEELESGSYTLEVVVSNYTSQGEGEDEIRETIIEKNFDVAYLINLRYEYDNSIETYEVVKGKSYYYLDGLPVSKKFSDGKEKNVKWYLNNTLISATDIVTNSCTYEIEGKTVQGIIIPTDATYCESITYNGTNQVITKSPPTGVTLSNNVQTNAGNYTITAHLTSSQYEWEDGSTTDKTFNCTIAKAETVITCSDKTYTGSEQTACSCTGGTIGGTYKATNAGSYTASCTGDANHTSPANKSWTMSKIDSSITCKSAQNYTGSAITSYSTSSGCTPGTNKTVTNAGTYTVSCTGDVNHNNSTCSFTVNKVNATNPTLTAYSGGYDGSSHTIGVSGGSGGTIKYSKDNSSWSTTKPTLTSAGTTTVYVKVFGDSNHNDSTAISSTIKIYNPSLSCPSSLLRGNTGTATLSSSTGINNITYTSSNTSAATVSNGTISALAAGTGKTTITLKLDYASNSINKTCEVTVSTGTACYYTSSACTKDFATMQAAINAAPNNTSTNIKLLSDETTLITVPQSKKVVLNLNSKKVNVSSGQKSIYIEGEATINGNGTVTCTGGNSSGIEVASTGKLTVTNGTFTGSQHGIWSVGTTTITNGTFKGGYYSGLKFSGGTFTIQNATGSAKIWGMSIHQTATGTINGGTYTGEEHDGILITSTKKVTINNATATGLLSGIYTYGDSSTAKSNVQINGGTFYGKTRYGADGYTYSNLLITGGTYKACSYAVAASSNTASVTVNGTITKTCNKSHSECSYSSNMCGLIESNVTVK